MIEHGLYIVKESFMQVVRKAGGDFDYDDGGRRPVYCCIRDNKIDGLYWAVPTSDIAHRTEGLLRGMPEKTEG